jgi:PleD family two-component response regulator
MIATTESRESCRTGNEALVVLTWWRRLPAMTQANNARPNRVAIVDDDARNRDLLRRYLTQEGFDVLLAEDGKALARLLMRENVDLIGG